MTNILSSTIDVGYKPQHPHRLGLPCPSPTYSSLDSMFGLIFFKKLFFNKQIDPKIISSNIISKWI
jgi:hypothetical protein